MCILLTLYFNDTKERLLDFVCITLATTRSVLRFQIIFRNQNRFQYLETNRNFSIHFWRKYMSLFYSIDAEFYRSFTKLTQF